MAKIRLLACQQCKTIEELPDFDGPPEYDVLLSHLLEKHKTPGGTPHIGQLFDVDKDKWENGDKNTPASKVREDVARQISVRLSGGETGLGSPFYALHDTYKEDAMTCWKRHQRIPGCNDYKSEKMRLTPGTNAERKELGLDKYRSDRDVYLCQFCPVHSLVEQAQRAKAGLYK